MSPGSQCTGDAGPEDTQPGPGLCEREQEPLGFCREEQFLSGLMTRKKKPNLRYTQHP